MKNADIKTEIIKILSGGDTHEGCWTCFRQADELIALINEERTASYDVGYRDAEVHIATRRDPSWSFRTVPGKTREERSP